MGQGLSAAPSPRRGGSAGLSSAAAARTGGSGVGEREAGLGHPSCVRGLLLAVEAGQVPEGEEGFALQVVGPQRVVVEHGEQQAGPLLPALLSGDQAAEGATRTIPSPRIPPPRPESHLPSRASPG